MAAVTRGDHSDVRLRTVRDEMRGCAVVLCLRDKARCRKKERLFYTDAVKPSAPSEASCSVRPDQPHTDEDQVCCWRQQASRVRQTERGGTVVARRRALPHQQPPPRRPVAIRNKHVGNVSPVSPGDEQEAEEVGGGASVKYGGSRLDET